MTELGPDARALIELARREDDPDLGARERVQEALVARLNAGVSVPLATAKGGLLGVKSALLLTVLGALVAGGGTLYSQRRTALDQSMPPSNTATLVASPADVASRREPPQAAAREGEKTADTRSVMPLSEPEASTAPVQVPPTRSAARRQLDRTAPVVAGSVGDKAAAKAAPDDSHPTSPTANGVERPSPAGDALLAEARALREVQQVLRAGNAARALTLLAEQDRLFANGQLGEARAAARAMARCAAQSADEGRNTAATFEARWPRSILLSSVRSACGSSGARAGVAPQ